MEFFENIKERKQFNLFHKQFEENHINSNFIDNIKLCDRFILILKNDKRLESVKLRKCYTLLCVDNEMEFYRLSNEITFPENKLMISYYKVLLCIDAEEQDFNNLYNVFLSYKIYGPVAFHILNKEILLLRDAIINDNKILNKEVINRLKKSKITKIKRLQKYL